MLSGWCSRADVVSAETVPPFDNSAVDGYAVRADDLADVPVELTVVGEIAAGAAPTRSVGPGEAIRIMTGAPVPPTVRPRSRWSRTRRWSGRTPSACNAASVGEGQPFVVPATTSQVGDLLFTAGTEIRPAVEGVLASVNAHTCHGVPAARRRCAVDG